MLRKISLGLMLLSSCYAETLSIKSGWNMFSAPTDIELDRFNNSCVQYLWKYNVSNEEAVWEALVIDQSLYYGGEMVSSIRKGEGFWLKAIADCQLEINDISLVAIDPNTPLIDQKNIQIQEESLTAGQLTATQSNTTFRIVGGDDHTFFSVSSDGKLNFTKTLYSGDVQDISQDDSYNVVIETNSSGLTAKNNLEVKIIPDSEFKIASNFYSELPTNSNADYTPKVLGGIVSSVDGNITFSAAKPYYSLRYGNEYPEAVCLDGYMSSIVSIDEAANYSAPEYYKYSIWNGETQTLNDFNITDTENITITYYDMDLMQNVVVTDKKTVCKQVPVCAQGMPSSTSDSMDTKYFCVTDNPNGYSEPYCADMGTPIEGVLPTCDNGLLAVVDDNTEPKLDTLAIDENNTIQLPTSFASKYQVSLKITDGTKQALKDFNYTVVDSWNYTQPTPADIIETVSANQWSKIDFVTQLSLTKYYNYEIVQDPVNASIITKKDGTVWINANQNDIFKYKIRFHNGTDGVTDANGTVTVEVQ